MKHKLSYILDVHFNQEEAVILKEFFSLLNRNNIDILISSDEASVKLSHHKESYLAVINNFKEILLGFNERCNNSNGNPNRGL